MWSRERDFGGGVPEFMCALHQRRRVRSQLIDDPERPGQLRCDPERECRVAPTQNFNRVGDEGWCTCKQHGRRRLIHQMRQVGPGEYECTPPHLCHDGANPRPFRQRAFGGFGFQSTGAGGVQEHTSASFPSTVGSNSGGASFGPSVVPSQFQHIPPNVGGGRGPHFPAHSMYGQATYIRGTSQLTSNVAAAVEVWCSKHARFVDRNFCDWVDHVFFVCRDPSQCLSVRLDDPGTIRGGEVLCVRHQTLRLPSYLRRTGDEQGYECLAEHPCRSNQTHSVEAPIGDDVATGGVGFADPAMQAGIGNLPSYAGHPSSTNGFHSPQVHTSASSFFA